MERLEPTFGNHHYLAELQAQKKRKGENWADFADEFKSLADKAYRISWIQLKNIWLSTTI